jgi:hypothetical protein
MNPESAAGDVTTSRTLARGAPRGNRNAVKHGVHSLTAMRRRGKIDKRTSFGQSFEKRKKEYVTDLGGDVLTHIQSDSRRCANPFCEKQREIQAAGQAWPLLLCSMPDDRVCAQAGQGAAKASRHHAISRGDGPDMSRIIHPITFIDKLMKKNELGQPSSLATINAKF